MNCTEEMILRARLATANYSPDQIEEIIRIYKEPFHK